MESLFTLQYTCLLVFAMLMLQLLVSRLYQNSTTPQYEKSRMLLAATMLILVVHYALQIKFKLRANDDNVGTVFNTLFYPIANYFLACSIIQLQSSRKTTRRYAIVGALACLSIVGVFAIGWYTSGNMALDGMRGILFAMFALSMVYFDVAYHYTKTHTTPHQQRHRRRHINVRPLHKSKLSIAFHAVVHTYFCCNLATGIICRRSANAVHYVSVRFKFCGVRLQHGSR